MTPKQPDSAIVHKHIVNLWHGLIEGCSLKSILCIHYIHPAAASCNFQWKPILCVNLVSKEATASSYHKGDFQFNDLVRNLVCVAKEQMC